MTDEQLEQLSKPELIALVRELLKRIDHLERRVAELEAENARLKKDSSNSSKPPSSDIVKPRPAQRGKGKRKIGGQPGHPKHERTPFTPDQIDAAWDYKLDACPDCGGSLQNAGRQGRVIQQVELVAKPVRIEEHRALAYWCPHCRTHHEAALPRELRNGGLVGPRLTAWVAYLKGGCHASYTTIQTCLRDVMKLELSTGQLVKLVNKARAALDGPYDELLKALPSQPRLNIDETGHKDRGDKYWTWCFRAAPGNPGRRLDSARSFTLFKIDPSRGSNVLIETLGRQFEGVIGADYFSAYRKFMGDCHVLVQFCLAHLIRDVKFLTTLDRRTRQYGHRLLDRLRKLFGIIHRRDAMTEKRFKQALERARRKLLTAAKHPPWTTPAQNMANRFRQHGEAYFQFITTPGIEPTNNLAEQAIRFVVIDRKITQGTRGQPGQRWCERIWTTLATCTQQNRSVFDFLEQAVHAHFTGQPAPSLLFDSA